MLTPLFMPYVESHRQIGEILFQSLYSESTNPLACRKQFQGMSLLWRLRIAYQASWPPFFLSSSSLI